MRIVINTATGEVKAYNAALSQNSWSTTSDNLRTVYGRDGNIVHVSFSQRLVEEVFLYVVENDGVTPMALNMEAISPSEGAVAETYSPFRVERTGKHEITITTD